MTSEERAAIRDAVDEPETLAQAQVIIRKQQEEIAGLRRMHALDHRGTIVLFQMLYRTEKKLEEVTAALEHARFSAAFSEEE